MTKNTAFSLNYKRSKIINDPSIPFSFHVGMGCEDARAYHISVMQARDVFDTAIKLDMNMTLLDIGGGFPSPNNPDVSFVAVRWYDVIQRDLSMILYNLR